MDEEIDEFSLDDWFDRHPTDTVADVIRAFAARQRALDAKTTGGAE